YERPAIVSQSARPARRHRGSATNGACRAPRRWARGRGPSPVENNSAVVIRFFRSLLEARRAGELDRGFAAMVTERAGGLLVVGDSMFFLHRARLADLAMRNGLPSMSTPTQWVEAGGLVSYGVSVTNLFRRAATYVDKILKGAKPRDLPVEQP